MTEPEHVTARERTELLPAALPTTSPPPSSSPEPDPFAPRPHGSVAGWVVVAVLVVGAFVAGTFLRDKLPGRAASPRQAATTLAGAAKQLWTCGMHPQVIQDHPGECPICHMELTPLKVDAASEQGPGMAGPVVTIDPVIVQNMGVRIAPVVLGSVRQDVRVVGYLEEPEPLRRDVNLRVSGWIEKLHADTTGMPIAKGQPLFELYSPEIQVAVEELIAARKSRDAASDEQARRMADTLYQSTARKLELWGLEAKQIEELAQRLRAPETVTFVAPIGGHLTEKMVYEGAGVTAGMLVMRLSARERMWVDAQVFERQLPLVMTGSKARVTIASEPGRVYDGQVLFIHPHLDPTTRTALARIEIPNDEHRLRQGMYATVDIEAAPAPPALVVPREAVIDTGTRQVAFVAAGGGRFEPREVKLGISGRDGLVQVLSGLEPNEQVVTSGQFLLDSESRLKEAIQKHLSGNLAVAATAAGGHDHGRGMPSPASAPVATPAPPLNVPHADEIASAYLQIAQALGARQASDVPMDVDALLTAATNAAQHADGEGKALAEAVRVAAEGMKGKSLGEQRRAFLAVSDAVTALLDRSPPSAAVAPELYVARCPMAFDDTGAGWLQTTPTIANPYYATQMKSCGEVLRTIAARK